MALATLHGPGIIILMATDALTVHGIDTFLVCHDFRLPFDIGRVMAITAGIWNGFALGQLMAGIAGIVFRIKENVGIGLTVSYWERDSNIGAFKRSRGFIGGYLTYDF